MRRRVTEMGLRGTGNTAEPSWRNATAASRIDHIFYGGSQITEAWGGPREMVSVLTDHMPVFGIYKVATTVHKVTDVRFILQPDLKKHDKYAKQAIQKELTRIQERRSAEEDINWVTETTVQAYRTVIRKRSCRKWVDGWSPDMMAIQYAIRALICIRRHLRGQHQETEWTAQTYRHGMNIILKRWHDQLSVLANGKPETAMETMTRYTEDEEYVYVKVKDLDYEDMNKMVDIYIVRARKRSHGRIRTEQRMKISERVKRREESRQAGKLRPVLMSMLGPHRKRRDGYTMETLRINEHVEADPIRIHEVLTDNFQKWFSEPEGSQPREWEVHSTVDEFIESNKHLKIPVEVLTTIWSSLQDKLQTDETLAATPTFEEFSNTIDKMSKDSAPGMSGLSYNMMKVWGEDIRKRVYDDICELWEKGEFPTQWKLRWIVPIPKKSDPDIGDLRPLMLMEALRKVWGSIFVRRIQRKWKISKVLQPNQFGCVPGKGTDGAVVELLNAAETAKERKTPLYLTSWDIRRAFDSVAKPLVTIALKRLGIPTKLTEYITRVDRTRRRHIPTDMDCSI
jgi:hypothetical protein